MTASEPIVDLPNEVEVVNIGLSLFAESVAEQGCPVMQVDWRIPADGDLATVQNLGRVGAALVQVYGQHEQQSLLRAESHREILDRYARLEHELSEYRQAWEKATGLRVRVDELNRRERERADLLDLARFRIAELEKAGLVVGEDAALTAEKGVLANATKLARAASEARRRYSH